jgi:hypothetical protein
MKTSHNLSVDSRNPQAWIAIQKNRQKVYGSNGKSQVYLKDGQEFQIELFNPTQTKYLVKFKINGNYQFQRGLVLYPGQRYFLDRFIDEDRKLAFSTYDVENTKQVREAIEKNGLLEVEFYAETVYQNTFTRLATSSTPTYYGNQGSGGNYWLNGYGGITTNSGSGLTFGSITNSIGNGVSFTNCSLTSTLVSDISIETGRVEKGEKSNQSFSESFDSFNTWVAFSTKVQILPRSQKPAETSEIRCYCTGCGSRNKKQNWKFCPNCGTKI